MDGTEDYIGTGWMMGEYANLYQGCLLRLQAHALLFYRYHIPDPVYFHRAVRVTIQQIGVTLGQDVEGLGNAGEPIYKGGSAGWSWTGLTV